MKKLAHAKQNGSYPLLSYKAHSAKIYGIDWGKDFHMNQGDLPASSSKTLVTCSLDRTIKAWDLSNMHTSSSASERSDGLAESNTVTLSPLDPKYTIKTQYPAWKARNTPFGSGVLALPQRGETALEMWAWPGRAFSQPTHEDVDVDEEMGGDAGLIARFEGHVDIVKEFVWRVRPGFSSFEFHRLSLQTNNLRQKETTSS
jgi:hypothetical protein